MNGMGKLVYVPMAVDVLHPGHINIIKTAAKLGEVVVACSPTRRLPPTKNRPS